MFIFEWFLDDQSISPFSMVLLHLDLMWIAFQGRDDGRGRDRDRGKARTEAIGWDANRFPVLEQVFKSYAYIVGISTYR